MKPANAGDEPDIVAYFKENKKRIIHDFTIAKGTFFSQLALELNMTKTELLAWEDSLEGSEEQTKALEILSHQLNTESVAAFGAVLVSSMLKALGKDRTYAMLQNVYL